jgi:hypothetical protein
MFGTLARNVQPLSSGAGSHEDNWEGTMLSHNYRRQTAKCARQPVDSNHKSGTEVDSAEWLADRAAQRAGELRESFARLDAQAVAAEREIERLQDALEMLRLRCEAALPGNLGALRRQLAFQCHPDRGGDPALMSKLNALFDGLLGLERTVVLRGASSSSVERRAA